MGPNLSALNQGTVRKSMGEHIDTRKGKQKRKKGFNESVDPMVARARRVTFKNYLREQEEELLEADLEISEDDDDLTAE